MKKSQRRRKHYYIREGSILDWLINGIVVGGGFAVFYALLLMVG